MEFDTKKINVIAFYLPQYHSIPENDKAHGKGFTEWTNVKKAEPLFKGHRQPRAPLDSNYYCLLDGGKTMEEQAKLAKKYGIFGFCYYHYYFGNGKKLLEKPLEEMLENKNINMPFCLSWANENWTRKWDGGNNEVIAEQKYDNLGEISEHIKYVVKFMKDERYITINGSPLFIIYRPDIIPNVKAYVKEIRKCFKDNGFPKVFLAVQKGEYYVKGNNLGLFDYYIQYEPGFTIVKEFAKPHKFKIFVKKVLRKIHLKKIIELHTEIKYKKEELLHRNYDKDWKTILNYKVKDKRMIAGGFVDFDNTPRVKTGMMYDGVSTKKFDYYFGKLCEKVKNEYSLPLIFMMAWNEWGEGSYLEPDTDIGYSYLESIQKYVDSR